MLTKHGKRIRNGLQKIVLDYEARGFKVISMFGDGAFKPIVDWAQSERHIDLVTCAANSHVPRAVNAIRMRAVQSETPFDRNTKRFTIELLKHVIVLINSCQECIQ